MFHVYRLSFGSNPTMTPLEDSPVDAGIDFASKLLASLQQHADNHERLRQPQHLFIDIILHTYTDVDVRIHNNPKYDITPDGLMSFIKRYTIDKDTPGDGDEDNPDDFVIDDNVIRELIDKTHEHWVYYIRQTDLRTIEYGGRRFITFCLSRPKLDATATTTITTT